MPKRASKSTDRRVMPYRVFRPWNSCYFCGNPNCKIITDYSEPIRVCFDCHMEGMARKHFRLPSTIEFL